MKPLKINFQLRNPWAWVASHMIFGVSSLFFMSSAHAVEPAAALKVLSTDEMNFLLKNCPDMTRMVSSGVVVAYGEIIEAPMLVTVTRDAITINSVQVSPVQGRDVNFEANKIADRIHSQLYLDEQKGLPNAYALAEQRIRDYKASGRIDDFHEPKPGAIFRTTDIFWKGEHSDIHAKLAPRPLLVRYGFIVDSILHAYRMKKETEGGEKARQWLQARLEELKSLGVIVQFEFVPFDALEITYAQSTGPGGHGIGDPISPRGIEYTKSWKSKRAETQARADRIASQLKANQILIYSFAFEKSAPYNPSALAALRSLQQGRDVESNRQLIKKLFALTDQQVKALAEEIQ